MITSFLSDYGTLNARSLLSLLARLSHSKSARLEPKRQSRLCSDIESLKSNYKICRGILTPALQNICTKASENICTSSLSAMRACVLLVGEVHGFTATSVLDGRGSNSGLPSGCYAPTVSPESPSHRTEVAVSLPSDGRPHGSRSPIYRLIRIIGLAS